MPAVKKLIKKKATPKTKTRTMRARDVEIEIVRSSIGMSLYINGYRVLGEKPWGGGKRVYTWTETNKTLLKDVRLALKRVLRLREEEDWRLDHGEV